MIYLGPPVTVTYTVPASETGTGREVQYTTIEEPAGSRLLWGLTTPQNPAGSLCLLESPTPLGAGYDRIAPDLDARIPRARRNRIASRLGTVPFQATILSEMLWELYRFHGAADDPAKLNPPSTTSRRALELWVGGVRIRRRHRFDVLASPERAKVLEMARATAWKVRARELRGELPPGFSRRYVTTLLEKHGRPASDWRRFVRPEWPDAEAPLPHDTTLGPDPFTVGSNVALASYTGGPDSMAYAEDSGTWTVTTAGVCNPSGGPQDARQTTALSSDNHWWQAAIPNAGSSSGQRFGVNARIDGSAGNGFRVRRQTSTSSRIYRLALYAGTSLSVSPTHGTWADTDTIQCRCDGDTISSYRNGASTDSATDSAHKGHFQGGMWTEATKPNFDDFEGATLGAAGAPAFLPEQLALKPMTGIY